MTEHPKELSARSIDAFHTAVPTAKLNGSTAELSVDGQSGVVRIKRALRSANQVQVWRGEPILIHLVDDDADVAGKWVMLDVSWQLIYALNNPNAKQHASNSFDCMSVSKAALEQQTVIPDTALLSACERAIRNARRSEVRFVTKAIVNVQKAVAGALVETYQEVINESGMQDGSDDE